MSQQEDNETPRIGVALKQSIIQKLLQSDQNVKNKNQVIYKYTDKIFPIAKIKFSYKVNDQQLIKVQQDMSIKELKCCDQINFQHQTSIENGKQSIVAQLQQANSQLNTPKKYILVLCTGNSCRSQILQAYLKKFLKNKAQVKSAGVQIHGVNPKTIRILAEDGIDISQNTSNHVNQYRQIPFDYIITVCDNARQTCPYFPSKAVRIHHTFSDPAKAKGSQDEVMNSFRSVRDQICAYCKQFCQDKFGKDTTCNVQAFTINKNQCNGQKIQEAKNKNSHQRDQENKIVESEVEKLQFGHKDQQKLLESVQKFQKSNNTERLFDEKNNPKIEKQPINNKQICNEILRVQTVKNQMSGSQTFTIQNYNVQTPSSSQNNPHVQQSKNNVRNLFNSQKKQQKVSLNLPVPFKQQNVFTSNLINLIVPPSPIQNNRVDNNMNLSEQHIKQQRISQNNCKLQKQVMQERQISVQSIPLSIRKAWKK